MQSGLGRRDQRSGDAVTQAATPAEGGTSTEEGQGAPGSMAKAERRSPGGDLRDDLEEIRAG